MDPSIRQLDYLFSPRSLAVIGASNDAGKWGFGVIQSVLKDAGRFTVYPVNPKAAEVYGIKAFKRVTDIKDDLDFAVIVIPPEHVPAAMEDCVAKGVKAVLVITAGFRETGGEGAELESTVMDIARKGRIRVVGPNCNGHFNAAHGLFTTRSGKTMKGPISLVSQSGDFGGYILGNAAERGIGFSKYVSSGESGAIAELNRNNIFTYRAPEDGARVISYLVNYGRYLAHA